ncbi:hypothetical protein LP421_14580 [Rhizobium sp. RCAM05350]|nr:hypothetical protein LP421_14580 [Rhizobium sp. RCAM05350]
MAILVFPDDIEQAAGALLQCVNAPCRFTDREDARGQIAVPAFDDVALLDQFGYPFFVGARLGAELSRSRVSRI